jgi:hypothetical protein
VHAFAEEESRRVLTPKLLKSSLIELEIEDKTPIDLRYGDADSDQAAKHRLSKMQNSDHDTQPNTSLNKISPRMISPNASQGSGFTSNGGFHIPLTMCERENSDGTLSNDDKGVDYHLDNPQILKQPIAKATRVPPLLFSQSKPQKVSFSPANHNLQPKKVWDQDS